MIGAIQVTLDDSVEALRLDAKGGKPESLGEQLSQFVLEPSGKPVGGPFPKPGARNVACYNGQPSRSARRERAGRWRSGPVAARRQNENGRQEHDTSHLLPDPAHIRLTIIAR